MNNKYEEIETAIVDRLKPFEALDFEVVALPETNSGYKTPPNSKGKIYVCLHSSKFQDSKDIGFTSQIETVNMAIDIQSKLLRGNTGVYNIANQVRRYLVGFKPLGFWPMMAVESGLSKSNDSNEMHNHYMLFKTDYNAVVDDDPESVPLLETITYENTLVGDSFDVPRPEET